MPESDPPEEFARLLGKLVYHAGWVEHSLGELTVLRHLDGFSSTDMGWGLSGKRLIRALFDSLDDSDNHDVRLREVVDRYEQLATWRNRFIHSGWVAGDRPFVAGWHALTAEGTISMRSYMLAYQQFQDLTAA